ncbi:MAG: hypothetical protein QM737_15270 [Ferruginibacter sp.]
MPVNKEIILNQEDDKKPFSDEQTDKRIHEHLSNEKDEISEDDIRNVKTDQIIENNDDESMPDKLIGDDLEIQKVKDNEDPEIDSSWDILEP